MVGESCGDGVGGFGAAGVFAFGEFGGDGLAGLFVLLEGEGEVGVDEWGDVSGVVASWERGCLQVVLQGADMGVGVCVHGPRGRGEAGKRREREGTACADSSSSNNGDDDGSDNELVEGTGQLDVSGELDALFPAHGAKCDVGRRFEERFAQNNIAEGVQPGLQTQRFVGFFGDAADAVEWPPGEVCDARVTFVAEGGVGDDDTLGEPQQVERDGGCPFGAGVSIAGNADGGVAGAFASTEDGPEVDVLRDLSGGWCFPLREEVFDSEGGCFDADFWRPGDSCGDACSTESVAVVCCYRDTDFDVVAAERLLRRP